VALVTVRVVDPLTDPMFAVIVDCPGVKPLARLFDIVATAGTEEVQEVTWAVRVRVLPSVNVPVTANDSDVLWAIVGFTGLIATETRFARLTVSVVPPLADPNVALMVEVP
jgi:hypothetical protein